MKNYKSTIPSMADVNSWAMASMLAPENMVNITSLASAAKLEVIRESYRSKNLPAPSYTALFMKAVAEI